jgi:rare lipoprotein A
MIKLFTIRGSFTVLGGLLVSLLLSSCAGWKPDQGGKYYADDGPPPDYQDNHIKPDAVPRVEPRSKGGNPDSYVVFGKRYRVLKNSKGFVERGIASWYGKKFHGKRTSNGEIYDMYAMTAAHKTLPIPTYAEVKNIRTGEKIIVRVNDRGPFHDGRIIDLSYAAAQKLGVAATGTGLVEVRAIDPLTWQQGKSTEEITRVDIKPDRADRQSKIYIQLGAFSQKGNASALFARAKRNYLYKPFIANGKDSYGNNVYRVRIGPFNGVDHVDSMIARLLDVNFDEFHVVIE